MKILLFLISFVFLFSVGCSDLTETLNDGIPDTEEEGEVDVQQLLNGAYGNLRDIQSQDRLFALTTHPSDELAGPTRGRDWDDAGIWRVLHTHTWTTTHAYVLEVWKQLNRNAFNAQQVLCNGATGSIAAQATFLRVFNDFLVLDLFGQIPRRECGESLVLPPTNNLKRVESIDILIGELEAVFSSLPTVRPAWIATQNAGHALLAKLYLNRAVYLATDTETGGALAGPYNFTVEDMNMVIQHTDAIIGSGEYALDSNYFDNFIPENDIASTELIFTGQNVSGVAAGNVRAWWFMTLHYNQIPSGWNGFVALADLYNKFEDGDQRKTTDLPYLRENGSGINVGFLIDQQRDTSGIDLEDRQGNPLVFTEEFELRQGGDQVEVAGIRVVKYPPDFTTPGDAADNDYVFFRYSDVLLMKAEAILRGGASAESPLDIVNQVRSIRGASNLPSLTEQNLLDERSRELYLEGWRRNDQIRFNSFLGTWQQKPNASDASRLLFPIPSEAISTNPFLDQNPGY